MLDPHQRRRRGFRVPDDVANIGPQGSGDRPGRRQPARWRSALAALAAFATLAHLMVGRSRPPLGISHHAHPTTTPVAEKRRGTCTLSRPFTKWSILAPRRND